MSFGHLLVKARKEKNISQTELVKLLNDGGIKIAQSTLSAWERGIRWPRKSDIDKIDKILYDKLSLEQNALKNAWSLMSKTGNETERLFHSASDFLHQYGHEKYNLWLFRHNNLPYVNELDALEHLKGNIVKGLDYNFILFLDSTPMPLFRKAIEHLGILKKMLVPVTHEKTPKWGTVNVYLVDPNFSDNNKIKHDKLILYSNIINEQHSKFKFNEFSKEKKVDSLITSIGEYFSLALYQPKPGMISKPAANLQFRNVRTSPISTQLIYQVIWLQDEDAQHLLDRLEAESLCLPNT